MAWRRIVAYLYPSTRAWSEPSFENVLALADSLTYMYWYFAPSSVLCEVKAFRCDVIVGVADDVDEVRVVLAVIVVEMLAALALALDEFLLRRILALKGCVY